MSVFGTIMDKLGFKKRPAKTAPKKVEPARPTPGTSTAAPPAAQTRPATQTRPAPPTTVSKPAQGRPAPAKPAQRAVPGRPVQRVSQPRDSRAAPTPSMPPARAEAAASPAAIPMVDVVSKLDKLATANPQELNWRVSIVDLLKLLDMDSSLQARKELATELDIPADIMADNKSMNIWLHKTVMQKLAENGGNVPRELLD